MIQKDEVAAIMKSVAAVVRRYVDERLTAGAAVQATHDEYIKAHDGRLAVLERQFAEMPAPQPGRDGKDFDPGEIEAIRVDLATVKSLVDENPHAKYIDDVVNRKFDSLPKPVDGAPGKDVDPVVLGSVLSQLTDLHTMKGVVTEQLASFDQRIAAIPAGPRGEKGDRGDDGVGVVGPAGPRGEPGWVGPAGQKGADAPPVDIDAIVASVAALIPAPRDGIDGKDGAPGRDAPAVDVKAIVTEVASLIPAPRDGVDGRDGLPGADAPPVDVKAIIAEVASLVPVPRDGVDGAIGPSGPAGKDVDPEVLADLQSAVLTISGSMVNKNTLEAHLARVEDKFTTRLDALPVPKDGAPGPVGEPGRDADPDIVREIVSTEVSKAVAAIPVAKDGAPGVDGKDAPPVDIKAIVADVVALVPVPKDGINGADGLPGPAGKDADETLIKQLQTDVRAIREVDISQIKQVAQKALFNSEEAVDAADGNANDIEVLKSAPKPAASFFISDTGDMVSIYPDGETKTIGHVRGRDGVDGPKGDPGESVQGAPGEPGPSAYHVAKSLGFDGTETEWLDSLRGLDGRDALEVKILRGIDENRSYPSGTYAVHEGAFIRANRHTSAVKGDFAEAGWDIIFAGEGAIDIEQAPDLRSFTVRHKKIGGEVVEKRFTLPTVLYRGVYKIETPYSAGDSVTFGGSTWIANKATDDKPGTSDHWTLSVKQGRDGKEGRPGKDAPQPIKPIKLSNT